MSNLIEDLSKFRKQIDAIDDKIIALLQERLKIVEQVGQHKSKTSKTKSFIRAGREATMLRDLTERMGEKFPKAAIATIWRMIISSSLATEQDMSIVTYANKENNTCFWRAREYYGSFLKISKQNSVDKVIHDVASGTASVGVLPLVDNSQNPWWVRPNSEKNDVFVFARIPFVQNNDSAEAPSIAIANVEPEKTGEDISLLSVYNDDSGFESCLREIGGKIIEKHGDHNYLVEIAEFLSKEDESFKKIKETLGSRVEVRLMGAYAAPISG